MFIAVQNGVAQLLALVVMCAYVCIWGGDQKISLRGWRWGFGDGVRRGIESMWYESGSDSGEGRVQAETEAENWGDQKEGKMSTISQN